MANVFTTANTEGFNAAQLNILNGAYRSLSAQYPDLDRGTICDYINNNWYEDTNSAEQIVNSVKKLLD